MAKARKARLGRGLSSLVSMPEVSVEPPRSGDAEGRHDAAAPAAHDRDHHEPAPAAAEPASDDAAATGLRWIDVAAVVPNRFQPRRSFDEEALAQLAASIEREGLMQPIVVRRLPEADQQQQGDASLELVAGERRWRAAQRAGLEQVPAIVRDLDDQQLAEWAVIENLQREDLNAIERAQAFARLIEEFDLSHEQVADRVGVGRPTVSNTLRLLELPGEVQEMVRLGELSGGASRALLSLENHEAMLILARRAVGEGWSVRAIEAAVRRALQQDQPEQGDGEAEAPQPRPVRSPVLADLEEQLGSQLQTKVRIKRGRKKGSGTLMIEFFDLDQFDTLLQRLNVDIEQ